jgi:hypothetical protein
MPKSKKKANKYLKITQNGSTIEVGIWGGLLGPDFVAVNLLCPTPITTISMPRPKKKLLQKGHPSLDKSSLQNPKDLTRGLQETLQKSRRCL